MKLMTVKIDVFIVLNCHHHIKFSRVHNNYFYMKLTTQYKEHVHIILQLLDKKKISLCKRMFKIKIFMNRNSYIQC